MVNLEIKDILDILTEMRELSSTSLQSVYAAGLERARFEAEADYQAQMLGHIKAVIEAQALMENKTLGKAEIESKASEKYLHQLIKIRESRLNALESAAKHQQKLNQFKMLEAALIAEQSLLKLGNR